MFSSIWKVSVLPIKNASVHRKCFGLLSERLTSKVVSDVFSNENSISSKQVPEYVAEGFASVNCAAKTGKKLNASTSFDSWDLRVPQV